MKLPKFPAAFLNWPEGFIFTGEQLFDAIQDTVFFIKDIEGCYLVVNDTLVRRCGFKSKSDLIGKTALEVFRAPLGNRFSDQDRRVLAGAATVNSQLELHLSANGAQAWCLTWKVAIKNAEGKIVGLAGISRDVPQLAGPLADHNVFAKVIDHIQANIGGPLQVKDIAKFAGLSPFQIDQRIKDLFGLTTGQFVVRTRIDFACNRLRQSKDPISAIAIDCGYSDQAAFSRQFKKSVGVTALAYRQYRG